MRDLRNYAGQLLSGFASLLCLTFVGPAPASAIYGGLSAEGDIRVVSLVNSQDSFNSSCSGALITVQIVVSAAHCLGNLGFTYSSSRYTPKDLWVSQPGSDLNRDNRSDRVQVLRVIVTPGYNNTWDPANNNIITQKDDIAFYFLEKPLVAKYMIEVASEAEVREIKQRRLSITHLGYGLQDQNFRDGKPHSLLLEAFSQGSTHYGTHPAREENTIASKETGLAALCPGDSGGPWYATVSGVEKIVAVTVAASGCRGEGSGRGGTLGTLIHPYLESMYSEWKLYLEDLPSLSRNKKVTATPINLALPLIQRSGGCDAKVHAELQILKDGKWFDYMSAQGWAMVANCPNTNPYQPWVRAQLDNGVEIRWHIYDPGNWDFYTNPEKYVAPKAAASKTTPPTAKTKARAKSKSPSIQKALTCVKGKKVVVVSGKAPKCPAGYRAK